MEQLGKPLKCLLWEHKDPSLVPRTHVEKPKLGVVMYTDNLSTDEAERWIRPAILA